MRGMGLLGILVVASLLCAASGAQRAVLLRTHATPEAAAPPPIPLPAGVSDTNGGSSAADKSTDPAAHVAGSPEHSRALAHAAGVIEGRKLVHDMLKAPLLAASSPRKQGTLEPSDGFKVVATNFPGSSDRLVFDAATVPGVLHDPRQPPSSVIQATTFVHAVHSPPVLAHPAPVLASPLGVPVNVRAPVPHDGGSVEITSGDSKTTVQLGGGEPTEIPVYRGAHHFLLSSAGDDYDSILSLPQLPQPPAVVAHAVHVAPALAHAVVEHDPAALLPQVSSFTDSDLCSSMTSCYGCGVLPGCNWCMSWQSGSYATCAPSSSSMCVEWAPVAMSGACSAAAHARKAALRHSIAVGYSKLAALKARHHRWLQHVKAEPLGLLPTPWAQQYRAPAYGYSPYNPYSAMMYASPYMGLPGFGARGEEDGPTGRAMRSGALTSGGSEVGEVSDGSGALAAAAAEAKAASGSSASTASGSSASTASGSSSPPGSSSSPGSGARFRSSPPGGNLAAAAAADQPAMTANGAAPGVDDLGCPLAKDTSRDDMAGAQARLCRAKAALQKEVKCLKSVCTVLRESQRTLGAGVKDLRASDETLGAQLAELEPAEEAGCPGEASLGSEGCSPRSRLDKAQSVLVAKHSKVATLPRFLSDVATTESRLRDAQRQYAEAAGTRARTLTGARTATLRLYEALLDHAKLRLRAIDDDRKQAQAMLAKARETASASSEAAAVASNTRREVEAQLHEADTKRSATGKGGLAEVAKVELRLKSAIDQEDCDSDLSTKAAKAVVAAVDHVEKVRKEEAKLEGMVKLASAALAAEEKQAASVPVPGDCADMKPLDDSLVVTGLAKASTTVDKAATVLKELSGMAESALQLSAGSSACGSGPPAASASGSGSASAPGSPACSPVANKAAAVAKGFMRFAASLGRSPSFLESSSSADPALGDLMRFASARDGATPARSAPTAPVVPTLAALSSLRFQSARARSDDGALPWEGNDWQAPRLPTFSGAAPRTGLAVPDAPPPPAPLFDGVPGVGAGAVLPSLRSVPRRRLLSTSLRALERMEPADEELFALPEDDVSAPAAAPAPMRFMSSREGEGEGGEVDAPRKGRKGKRGSGSSGDGSASGSAGSGSSDAKGGSGEGSSDVGSALPTVSGSTAMAAAAAADKAAAAGSTPGSNAGSDAGSSAVSNAGSPAGSDAGSDAGSSAGSNVGSSAASNAGSSAGSNAGSPAASPTNAGSADAPLTPGSKSTDAAQADDTDEAEELSSLAKDLKSIESKKDREARRLKITAAADDEVDSEEDIEAMLKRKAAERARKRKAKRAGALVTDASLATADGSSPGSPPPFPFLPLSSVTSTSTSRHDDASQCEDRVAAALKAVQSSKAAVIKARSHHNRLMAIVQSHLADARRATMDVRTSLAMKGAAVDSEKATRATEDAVEADDVAAKAATKVAEAEALLQAAQRAYESVVASCGPDAAARTATALSGGGDPAGLRSNAALESARTKAGGVNPFPAVSPTGGRTSPNGSPLPPHVGVNGYTQGGGGGAAATLSGKTFTIEVNRNGNGNGGNCGGGGQGCGGQGGQPPLRDDQPHPPSVMKWLDAMREQVHELAQAVKRHLPGSRRGLRGALGDKEEEGASEMGGGDDEESPIIVPALAHPCLTPPCGVVPNYGAGLPLIATGGHVVYPGAVHPAVATSCAAPPCGVAAYRGGLPLVPSGGRVLYPGAAQPVFVNGARVVTNTAHVVPTRTLAAAPVVFSRFESLRGKSSDAIPITAVTDRVPALLHSNAAEAALKQAAMADETAAQQLAKAAGVTSSSVAAPSVAQEAMATEAAAETALKAVKEHDVSLVDGQAAADLVGGRAGKATAVTNGNPAPLPALGDLVHNKLYADTVAWLKGHDPELPKAHHVAHHAKKHHAREKK